jgi:hypothetical protein
MMPRNALPLTAIALCVALLVWQFVPVPLGVDPDNWGRFIGILLSYAALFSLGLIGMATALRGQRDFFLPLALLSTPLIRLRAFSVHPDAGSIALFIAPLLLVSVAAAIALRRNRPF